MGFYLPIYHSDLQAINWFNNDRTHQFLFTFEALTLSARSRSNLPDRNLERRKYTFIIEKLKDSEMLDPLGQAWQNGSALAP